MHILFKLSTTEVSVWKCGVRAIWKNYPWAIQTSFLSKTLAVMAIEDFACLKILHREPFLGFTVVACNEGTHII